MPIETQALKATELLSKGREISMLRTVVLATAFIGVRAPLLTFCQVVERGIAPSLAKAHKILRWQLYVGVLLQNQAVVGQPDSKMSKAKCRCLS